MRLVTRAALAALVVPAAAGAAVRRPPVPSTGPVATYSIVARDAETGQLGVAVQSHWFSVGSIVTWAEAGVGAVATQSFARAAYGPELLDDLRGGAAPKDALAARVAADPLRAERQVAVVDAKGRVAAHTGGACVAHAADLQGDGFSVQANIMVDETVVPAMAAAFRAARGDLAERLVVALEAAQGAGGDLRGKQSAALLVVDGTRREARWDGVLVDLRVDDHPTPLVELRRLLSVHRAYAAANRGDEMLAKDDLEGALGAYAEAERLLPDNPELTFWRAITLLGEGGTLLGEDGQQARVEEALLRVYEAEPAWRQMPRRLVEAGHLKVDETLLRRLETLGLASEDSATTTRP